MSTIAADVMTSGEVAAWLRETVKTIESWARAGRIPGHKIGKRWKFIRSEVEAALFAAPGGPARF
jgi:excisionase family DNA binding protein